MDKRNILYLHIPKTAGSTIMTAFEDVSKNKNKLKFIRKSAYGIVPKFSLNYIEKMRLNQSINILTGHFVFSNFCKKFELYTIVRETLDLFISNLYFNYKRKNFLKKRDNVNNFKNNFNLKFSFTEDDLLIVSKLLEKNYLNSNTITKTLAGIPYHKFFYVNQDYKIKNDDYLRALENLNYFSYIGNTSDIDKFIDKFSINLSISNINYNSVNISKKNSNWIDLIKKNLNEEIESYNHYDTKILNIIKNKFD